MVSLLKPVRGVDPGARENFESFFRLEYPTFELLFAVADPDDPVLPLLETLRREHPRIPVQILVAPAPGPNRKADLLHPLGHVGYALTFATPLGAAAFLASGGAPVGIAALAGSLALRWAVAAGISRATGDGASLRALPLLPLRDALTAAVWAVALFGHRVVWRGEAFDVDRAGRLRPRSPPVPASPRAGAASADRGAARGA